jgi:Plasmid pRiA4b ORF-3-like protein
MAFQFKIQLSGLKDPKVWREFIVNENITFHDFHDIIQECMGWGNYHMYQFSPTGYDSYPCMELKTPDSESEFSPISNLRKGYELTYDSSKAKLSDYFNTKGQKITYIYDFGDDWKHILSLKKIWPSKTDHPMLVAAEGKCPPEDCGGIWGYEELIETVSDPKHREYEDLREWLDMEEGDVWDAAQFDMVAVNEKLKKFK